MLKNLSFVVKPIRDKKTDQDETQTDSAQNLLIAKEYVKLAEGFMEDTLEKVAVATVIFYGAKTAHVVIALVARRIFR